MGEACDECGVVEFGVGDDGGSVLGVVCLVRVDDEEVGGVRGKFFNECLVCVVICLNDFLSPVWIWGVLVCGVKINGNGVECASGCVGGACFDGFVVAWIGDCDLVCCVFVCV